MAVKLIAFDLDGTAIVDHWVLPERNRRALLAAAGRGILLVPATGRMRSFIPREVLDLPVRYAITSNGGATYDLQSGEAVGQELIPNRLAIGIYHILREYDIYMEYYTGGRAVTVRELRDRALDSMLPERKRWLVAEKDYIYTGDIGGMLRDTGMCPEKVNLPYMVPAVREEIWRRLEALGGLRLTSSIPDNIEINAASAHKGAALLALGKRLGLEREELFAIGDNGNDVTMLEAAGCSAAMGDGSADAKAAAKHITDAHDAEGLAHAVERLVLGE